ncbi:hypothetical protein [Thalassococcus sp. S3]|uniref:hypothetical protein n=1 Tax=Thalassococcus sp. S3 TaxID=2017482 RepID=UPI00102489D6|nr:hypothetical protein [Thalassococcus sp. S3]QBF31335.1 NADH dehydrogenase subunit D [Thalassococcus sp. S3]
MGGVFWIICALTAIPMLKLLPHFGVNKWWALACLVPIGVPILAWVMAMKLQELEKL